MGREGWGVWVIGLRCVGKLAEVYTVDIGANVCTFYYRQSTVCSHQSQLFVHTFQLLQFLLSNLDYLLGLLMV